MFTQELKAAGCLGLNHNTIINAKLNYNSKQNRENKPSRKHTHPNKTSLLFKTEINVYINIHTHCLMTFGISTVYSLIIRSDVLLTE